jgi:hypothetical protein
MDAENSFKNKRGSQAQRKEWFLKTELVFAKFWYYWRKRRVPKHHSKSLDDRNNSLFLLAIASLTCSGIIKKTRRWQGLT